LRLTGKQLEVGIVERIVAMARQTKKNNANLQVQDTQIRN